MIPLRKEQVDLKELVGWAIEGVRHECEHGQIELRVVVKGDLPKIEVDPEKIGWAVATLVGNSLRYVKRGTRRMPGGSIVVELEREGGAVAISVSDDGPGIPKEKLPWLFERQKGAKHAAGLALLLVHDVVVAHDGTMKVTSERDGLDHGTRITLRLPSDARSST